MITMPKPTNNHAVDQLRAGLEAERRQADQRNAEAREGLTVQVGVYTYQGKHRSDR